MSPQNASSDAPTRPVRITPQRKARVQATMNTLAFQYPDLTGVLRTSASRSRFITIAQGLYLGDANPTVEELAAQGWTVLPPGEGPTPDPEALKALGWEVFPPGGPSDEELAILLAARGLEMAAPPSEPPTRHLEARPPTQRSQAGRLLTALASSPDGYTDTETATAAGLRLTVCYWKRMGELRASGMVEWAVDAKGEHIRRRSPGSRSSNHVNVITDEGRSLVLSWA